MGCKFEVGKNYKSNGNSKVDSIYIIKRTEKTILVSYSNVCWPDWRMRIKIDENGDEYVVDSCSQKKNRNDFTYNSRFKF